MQNEIPLRLRWTCANSGNTTSSRSFDRLQQGSLRSKNIIYIRSDNPKELSGKKSELYHKVRLLSLSICQPELPLQVNKFVQILNTSCKFHHKSFILHQHPYSHNLNIIIFYSLLFAQPPAEICGWSGTWKDWQPNDRQLKKKFSVFDDRDSEFLL